MIVLPPFLHERTWFSDECYGIIGRALVFANNFEMNCKSLAVLIKMKNGLDLNDEQSVAEFCQKLKRALGYWTQEITKTFKKMEMDPADGAVTEYLSEKLEDAREARNIIAHDLTKGIEHYAEDDTGRKNFIKEVETLVRRIAEVDVQVYNLCQVLNKEPCFVDTNKYCEKAVNWVCEVEEEF